MARYIDADKLSIYFNALAEHAEMEGLQNMAHIHRRCLQRIAEEPTADVAPKSEVEKAIDDLKRYIILNEDISKKCKMENGEQNEEYWKGKLSAFLQIRGYLDTELKKKYQKGEPNGSKN